MHILKRRHRYFQKHPLLIEKMEWISLTLSGLALTISIIVACFHYRRDHRESKKFKSDNEQAKKKVKFSISEINYSLERGADQTGKFFEHHLVTFDVFILNVGIPPIYLDKIGVVFTKPLVGEVITSFTFSVHDTKNKIEQGEKFSLRFAQAFDSKELAYDIINSQFMIKLSNIQNEALSSDLINPAFGDSI